MSRKYVDYCYFFVCNVGFLLFLGPTGYGIFVCVIICYSVLCPLGDRIRKKVGVGRDLAFVGLVYGILIVYDFIEIN